MPHSPRTALVISGGTARGAYAAGLLQRLFAGAPQLAQHVQILSGTSTGSLIAPMLGLYCLDPVGHADLLDVIVRHYEVASTEVFRDEPTSLLWSIVRRVLSLFGVSPTEARMAAMLGETGAVVDPTPLRRTIETEYHDGRLAELFAARDRLECLINCVSMQTGSLVAFSSADPRMSPAKYREAIYASCMQPVFMPLVPIADATGATQEYIDGGIRDVVPVDAAWRAGATRVLAISLYPDDLASHATTERFAGRAQLLNLTQRVVVGLLDDEVQDDDLLQARYLSTIGKLVGFAVRHGASPEALGELLASLSDEERARFEGPLVFDRLYVHRPSATAPLVDALRWDTGGMRASIEAGRAAADGDEGRGMRDFLMAP
jgi:predicted acylesterase/phospholipase RssA